MIINKPHDLATRAIVLGQTLAWHLLESRPYDTRVCPAIKPAESLAPHPSRGRLKLARCRQLALLTARPAAYNGSSSGGLVEVVAKHKTGSGFQAAQRRAL